MEDIIRKHALHNAVEYDGKADVGSVIGKVIQDVPDAKDDIDKLKQRTATIVQEVNELPLQEQQEELQNLAPELLEDDEDEQDLFEQFTPDGEVVTAFPPEPSKYPHIGHAKSLIVNYEYARRHGGTCILRFEDTNPETAEQQYYDMHKRDYKWLGVEFDDVVNASDYIEEFYNYGEQLIRQGDAYVSHATSEEVKESRRTGKATPYRSRDVGENVDDWKAMHTDGEGIVRAKIDLEHKNSAMRDPTLFRVIDTPHPQTGSEYRVWPTYDFANAVLDAVQGMTLRFRTKEFELRSELQRYLQERLGLDETETYEFARFEMEGVETSGRVIREHIESGELLGWDDPSLATLAALRRRGFQPEAIREFLLKTGLSKTESTVTWDDLYVENRRVLDDEAQRYFFIEDPVTVTINDAPERDIELDAYPSGGGGRPMHVTDTFLLERDDVEQFEDGTMYRLMECLNFVKRGEDLVFHSTSHDAFEGEQILHFLPAGDVVDARVLFPDKSVTNGIAESNITELEEGSVIQFTRKYFARLDSANDLSFWYTHR